MNTTTPWFKSKRVRIGFTIFLAIAVILIALFFKPLSELLNLFGTKAALETETHELKDSNFFDGYTSTPQDGFRLEGGKLKLNPINPT